MPIADHSYTSEQLERRFWILLRRTLLSVFAADPDFADRYHARWVKASAYEKLVALHDDRHHAGRHNATAESDGPVVVGEARPHTRNEILTSCRPDVYDPL